MKKLIVTLLLFLLPSVLFAADQIRVAVTTSFHNSGLADILVPRIYKDTGLEVQLLVVGTGQALKLGRAGDVDALLVHSKEDEETFVKEGHATHRREIMYNDFVLLGPDSDPANVKDAGSIAQAFQNILNISASFVSRGDESGTHKKEVSIWAKASSAPKGSWYKQIGAGMGAALNTASALNAYTLSDRATWLNFKNKGELSILFEGDPTLFNQYSFLPINPDRHRHVKSAFASELEAWLTSSTAEELIDSYQISGTTLFKFNASD